MMVMNKKFISLILFLLVLLFSCSDSSSADKSVMIFEVTTVDDLPIDEYANNFKGSTYPITITFIDYENGSEFTGTVITSKIGLSSITDSCLEGSSCFWVDLDSTYFPFESFFFSDLIINNSQMKGRFQILGPTIDIAGFEFIASRKE